MYFLTSLANMREIFYTHLSLNVCISYWGFAGFCFVFLIKIINADHLKTNCQMKRLQSGTTSGFADMIQLKQLFSELNSNTGEW